MSLKKKYFFNGTNIGQSFSIIIIIITISKILWFASEKNVPGVWKTSQREF